MMRIKAKGRGQAVMLHPAMGSDFMTRMNVATKST